MSRYSCILIGIILIKTLAFGLYISQGYVGLGPDEAQYWTWSRHIDWGYYSKPPGIALQIAAGTAIFGDTELGVRFGSLVLAACIPLTIYALTFMGGLSRIIAFWAALAFAFSPLGMMSSLLAITDVGMALSWVLAAYWMIRCLRQNAEVNYIIPGLLIACGAIFKWPVYFFWTAVALGMLFLPALRSRTVIYGFLISLLGLVPVLIWNIQHDWVTFRHVGVTIAGGHGAELGTTLLMKGNVLEFLGAQMLLVSPILFILMLCGWVYVYRHRKVEIPLLLRWGALTSSAFVAAFTAAACLQKIQGNWCVFAYLIVFPLIVWISLKWARIGIIFSLLLCVLLLSVPFLQDNGIGLGLRWSPFKHNMGWGKLSPGLLQKGYNPAKDFLFGESYQTTSLLSFYGPEQKKAYFLNLEGARHNQFDIWPGMKEEQLGKTGYFVQVVYKSPEDCDINKLKQLQEYFKKIECLGLYPLLSSEAKFIRIWRCEEYNGTIPLQNTKY
ncbi:MAG: glycosyltransferase family 39 protein [Parachlamydiales bacterium]|jgi:hypothetical protein